MGGFYGCDIVTDGLVLYLDSHNQRSNSVDLWRDLSGFGNNLSLIRPYSYTVFDSPINYSYDPVVTPTFRLNALNGYVPGRTQNITFELAAFSALNYTKEYGDFFQVTFPEGFFINSASPTLGVSEVPGGEEYPGGFAENLNSITNGGRTVSWGDNDDWYGGISYIPEENRFTLNITVDANVQGTQSLDCLISGDGFWGPHSGIQSRMYSGTASIGQSFTNQINYTQNGIIFNGVDDCLVGKYNSSLNLSTNNFTIEAWFNSSSFTTGQIIIAKDTLGNNYDWSLYIPNSTSLAIYSNGTSTNVTATVPVMSVGEWYQFSVTCISGIVRIYLNGVVYVTQPMSFSNNSQSYFTVGCSGWNNPNSFINGKISIVRIYSRGLSELEVLHNYSVNRLRFN